MNALRTSIVASSIVVLLGCSNSDNNVTDRAREALARRKVSREIDARIAKYTTPHKSDAASAPASDAALAQTSSARSYTGKVFRVIPPLNADLGYTIIFRDGACAYDLGVSPGVPDSQFPHIRQVRYGLAVGSMPKGRDVTITYDAVWTSMDCMDVHSLSVPAWKKR